MRDKYLKKSWISPKIKVRNSQVHGKGLFAKEPIKKGEIVIIWGGNFVNEDKAQKAKLNGKVIQQIDENVWDVFNYKTRNDDPSYNHNHSCNPNTWMKNEVTITARRDIKSKEELTIDYAMFILDEAYIMPDKCRCRTTLCRHTITGKDWQLPELQRRYEKHFNTLLNKKIKNNSYKEK